MHTTVEEVIKRINDWKDKAIHYEPLGGGITNHNYKVNVGDETFVLRIPGAGTSIFIDRDNELNCSLSAGETGVVPKVMYHLKPENITIVQFIKGKTLNTEEIIGSDELIRRILKAIKTIHDKASFKNIFNPFDTIRNYMNYVEKYSAPLPSDFDWMLTLAHGIEKSMKRNPPESVACHNDYLSENFLDDGNQIWIIDWEYGGQGDPFFDLGDFAVEHPFTDEQEELIIKKYCGELKLNRLYRMRLYKIISDLWWSIWAMIQSRVSKIDFDFYTYGNRRFDRLRRNAKNYDYSRWIDGV